MPRRPRKHGGSSSGFTSWGDSCSVKTRRASAVIPAKRACERRAGIHSATLPAFRNGFRIASLRCATRGFRDDACLGMLLALRYGSGRSSHEKSISELFVRRAHHPSSPRCGNPPWPFQRTLLPRREKKVGKRGAWPSLSGSCTWRGFRVPPVVLPSCGDAGVFPAVPQARPGLWASHRTAYRHAAHPAPPPSLDTRCAPSFP